MCKTIYLDYANWIDLTRGKTDINKFKKALQENVISPILSFMHILEIANSGEKSRVELSRFLDNITVTLQKNI